MKAFGLIFLLAAMAIAAYLTLGPRDAPRDAPVAQNAKHLEDKARAAVAGANLDAVRRGIMAFQASKDRLPVNLEEVRDAGYLEKIPAGVVYDPATGSVSMP